MKISWVMHSHSTSSVSNKQRSETSFTLSFLVHLKSFLAYSIRHTHRHMVHILLHSYIDDSFFPLLTSVIGHHLSNDVPNPRPPKNFICRCPIPLFSYITPFSQNFKFALALNRRKKKIKSKFRSFNIIMAVLLNDKGYKRKKYV
jgi:hypothetical protein